MCWRPLKPPVCLCSTQVYSADEAFVTGTFAGLLPVVEVDGRRIGSGVCCAHERCRVLHDRVYVFVQCPGHTTLPPADCPGCSYLQASAAR